MTALDINIEQVHRRLEASAGAIALMPATTIANAIAKIEFGLKLQRPFGWRSHAAEILEDGIDQLRSLLMA